MIITLAHTKGGVGKSTLAWHLAHSIGHGTTVIDLDFQQTIHYLNIMSGYMLNVMQPRTSSELIEILKAVPSDKVVIIDVGGFDSDINRTAIRYSDKILIPISDSVTEVLGFHTFKSILSEIGSNAEAYMVFNNIHPLTRNFDTIREAISDTNIVLLDSVIRSRKIYRSTMGDGKSVFDLLDLDNSAKTEIERLRDELISPK